VQLLTPDEVIARLRLDDGCKDPRERLKHLRRTRALGFIRLGRRTIRYRQSDVDAFIARRAVEAR